MTTLLSTFCTIRYQIFSEWEVDRSVLGDEQVHIYMEFSEFIRIVQALYWDSATPVVADKILICCVAASFVGGSKTKLTLDFLRRRTFT